MDGAGMMHGRDQDWLTSHSSWAGVVVLGGARPDRRDRLAVERGSLVARIQSRRQPLLCARRRLSVHAAMVAEQHSPGDRRAISRASVSLRSAAGSGTGCRQQ